MLANKLIAARLDDTQQFSRRYSPKPSGTRWGFKLLLVDWKRNHRGFKRNSFVYSINFTTWNIPSHMKLEIIPPEIRPLRLLKTGSYWGSTQCSFSARHKHTCGYFTFKIVKPPRYETLLFSNTGQQFIFSTLINQLKKWKKAEDILFKRMIKLYQNGNRK